MLIYRIESGISFFSDDVKVEAGYGPYGSRGVIRSDICQRSEDFRTINVHPIIQFMNEYGLLNFMHSECSMDIHPAPSSDKMLMKSMESKFDERGRPVRYALRDYHFGFNSIDQLKRWFNESARDRLFVSGYYVAIYEVTEYHEGETQCVFKKESAKLVDFLSCGEI